MHKVLADLEVKGLSYKKKGYVIRSIYEHRIPWNERNELGILSNSHLKELE